MLKCYAKLQQGREKLLDVLKGIRDNPELIEASQFASRQSYHVNFDSVRCVETLETVRDFEASSSNDEPSSSSSSDDEPVPFDWELADPALLLQLTLQQSEPLQEQYR